MHVHTHINTHSHLQEQESSSGALMISTTLKHDKVAEGIGHWSTRKSRRKASEDQELTGEPILSRGEPSVWMTGMFHHCGRQRVFSTSQSQGTAFQVVVLPVLRFHTPSVTFSSFMVQPTFSEHQLYEFLIVVLVSHHKSTSSKQYLGLGEQGPLRG